MICSYMKLARFFKEKLKERKTVIIAIDGPGGSGKSFFAQRLSSYISRVQIVHFDDFYFESFSPKHGSNQIGSSFDWQRLEKVLLAVRAGKKPCYQKYDWTNDRLEGKYEVIPEEIIIIEGVYTLRRELRDYYDFKIWIEVDSNLRLIRGIERDGEKMREKWTTEWMPKEDQYIESNLHSPRDYADIIVHGDGSYSNINDSFKIIKSKVKLI